MIKRSLIVVASLIACVSCKTGGGDSNASDSELATAKGSTATKRKTGEVAGWGFDGFKFAKRQNPSVFCTQEVKPEQDACFKAKGTPIAIDTCKFLCSVPIIDSSKSPGKVIGFSFKEVVTADVARSEFCPQVVSAEEEACRDVGGKIIAAKGCKRLCSKPIAARGFVAGYNFDGVLLNQPELPEDVACAQMVRPEEESCRDVKGKIKLADGCKPLCSEIINP